MSSLAKDEMESSHWSGDLIEVKTEAYTISRLPRPNKVGFQTLQAAFPCSRVPSTRVGSSVGGFQCLGLEWGCLAWVEASPLSRFFDLGLASLFGGQAG